MARTFFLQDQYGEDPLLGLQPPPIESSAADDTVTNGIESVLQRRRGLPAVGHVALDPRLARSGVPSVSGVTAMPFDIECWRAAGECRRAVTEAQRGGGRRGRVSTARRWSGSSYILTFVAGSSVFWWLGRLSFLTSLLSANRTVMPSGKGRAAVCGDVAVFQGLTPPSVPLAT